MNVSDQIIQVIEHLAQKFGIAINWSSENIMPIVEELCTKYISYEIMTSKAWIIGASIILLLIIIGEIFILIDPLDELYNLDKIGLTFCMVLLAAFPIACICVQTFDIIRCTTFPELQILQYIQCFMN
jgi:hypothetical protein